MNIRREHSLGADEARTRVDGVAAEFGDRLGLKSEWQGDALRISGSGVKGSIAIGDEFVEVDVNLGFALMFMESSIRSSIEAALDKHLAA